jgi:hypothetical protein
LVHRYPSQSDRVAENELESRSDRKSAIADLKKQREGLSPESHRFPVSETARGGDSHLRWLRGQDIAEIIEQSVGKIIDAKLDDLLSACRELEHERAPFDRMRRLEDLLLDSDHENQRLIEELDEARETLRLSMHPAIPDGREGSWQRDQEVFQENERLTCQNHQLQQRLVQEQARYGRAEVEIAELITEIEHLQAQIKTVNREAYRYEMQINDLSRQIARLKGPAPAQLLHALSWEDRKQLLLDQLAKETIAAQPSRLPELLDMERVIEETSQALSQKDQEIRGLIKLIEEQSIAKETMAIGASAAMASIDSDPTIAAERERLRALQAQWEESQRQFEIEMSQERAKLACEREVLRRPLTETRADALIADIAAEPSLHAGRSRTPGEFIE